MKKNNDDYDNIELLEDSCRNLLIPLELNAPKDAIVTFTSTLSGIPDNIKLYFEDRSNMRYMRLYEKSSLYKVKLYSACEGKGRFFLLTSPSITENDLLQAELITNGILTFGNKIQISVKLTLEMVSSVHSLQGQTVYYFMLSMQIENDSLINMLVKNTYLIGYENEKTTIIRQIYGVM